jgi:hypothetical protein
MDSQLELFEPATVPSTSVVGLVIITEERPCPCPCGELKVTVGASAGPHHAALTCTSCKRHRGWLSGETYRFIIGVIDSFGRPTEPIVAKFKNSRASVNTPQQQSN